MFPVGKIIVLEDLTLKLSAAVNARMLMQSSILPSYTLCLNKSTFPCNGCNLIDIQFYFEIFNLIGIFVTIDYLFNLKYLTIIFVQF